MAINSSMGLCVPASFRADKLDAVGLIKTLGIIRGLSDIYSTILVIRTNGEPVWSAVRDQRKQPGKAAAGPQQTS